MRHAKPGFAGEMLFLWTTTKKWWRSICHHLCL
jgi:hypothetical protein